MEDDTNNNIAINWNNIVGQEARSIDNADLGTVQGLFEPFIVTERGTINKEKFYIPKCLIIRYNDEILYFDITEQQAKDYCMRTTPPPEYEVKGMYRYYQKEEDLEKRREGKKKKKKKNKPKLYRLEERSKREKGRKCLRKYL
jgi:hypothetical protein